MTKLTLMFTLLFALIWGSYITMAESTIIVNTTSDELNSDGDCSLREAIEAVNTDSNVDNCSVSGGSPYTIELSAGTYTLSRAGAGEDHNQTGDLDIKSDVTINGVDAESTIIDGNQQDRVVQVYSGYIVEINHVKIANGKTQAGNILANSGAGVYNEGTLTLNHSMVSDNMTGSDDSHGGFGGAIYNYSDSTLTINHSTMSNNTTGYGSQHGGYGGAIYNYERSVLTITDSTISNNTAGDGGILGGAGGAVYNSLDSVLTINNSIMSNNSSGNGESEYGGYGGAVYNKWQLTINDSTISDNTTGSGKTYSGHGGAIYNHERGVATINNSTMSDNSTGSGNALGGAGGAIYNHSELTINHSTLKNNTTGHAQSGYGGFGGAVYNDSQLTINHSTIRNNTTGNGNTHGGYGAGVYNYLSGVLTINNSTISHNTTGTGKSHAGYGGGVYNGLQLTINHSTITHNGIGGETQFDAGLGAGIHTRTDSTNVKNTIIAQNQGNSDMSCQNGGEFSSYGYNLIQNSGNCTINEVQNSGSNVTGQPPLLAPLADHGGSTQTHALLDNSPAIDAGNCTDIAGNTVSTDQRGSSRPQGATCDIGSFESDLASTSTPIPSSTPMPSSTPLAATNTPVLPTSTPINTPNPSVGDAYEPDDACSQASSLANDGRVEARTFHTAQDVDWIEFEVSSGTEYVVEARTPDESLADVVLEVHGRCGAVPSFSQGHAFSPDVRLRFTAPETGSYYLRLNNNDPSAEGNLSYELSVRALPSSASPGAVVIVAGRLRINDSLQDEIHEVTNQVYRLFIANGYDSERIYYLATDLGLDADGDGVPDVDAQASRDNLQAAITNWAVDKVGPERALTLYLMDHGDINKIYLNGENQFVTPNDVDGWLETVEAAAAGVRVNVIVEACHAGSFIASPQSLSQPGRVVMASTGIYNLAYPSEHGAFFSDALLSALGRGMSLYGAFSEAQSAAKQAHPDQTPWLDDNGDGAYSSQDGQEAQVRGLAYAGTLDGEEKWPAYIARAEIGEVSDGDGVISADVRDDTGVLGVTAIIYKPSYIAPSQDAQEMPQEKLPTVTLRDTDGDGIYRATYEGFDEPGTYRIVLYAVDEEGIEARPRAIEMQLGGYQLYLPLVMR